MEQLVVVLIMVVLGVGAVAAVHNEDWFHVAAFWVTLNVINIGVWLVGP